MILELNTKHGFEVWINQQLVETIENEFKTALETDELYYYYIPCQCKTNREGKNEVKWVGKITLIDFIKKVQKIDSHFCPIGVTNAKSKKALLDYFDNSFDKKSKVWDYWIGDAAFQDMVCGDDLFIGLWERVKNKATKNAVTNKKFF